MAVTLSPGIATVAGIAGGGHACATQPMRDRLAAAAEALTELNDDFPVETRVNSDGQSGGAWLVTAPGGGIWSNAEVGLRVDDRTETFSAYVKLVALREDSPLRPDMTGYVFDPSRSRDSDILRTFAPRIHTGTLAEVVDFLTTHTRPAKEIAATLAEHRELARAYLASNAWWVAQHRGDDGLHYVAVARRTWTLDWFEHEPTMDALEQYAANTPPLRAGLGVCRAVTTAQLGLIADHDVRAADIEAGRVYEVTAGGLVATKFRSAKVAALSAAVLEK